MSLNVGVFTSTRADYGLLYPLVAKMMEDQYFTVELLVTGTHLSKKHGNTVNFIKKDNIPTREVKIPEYGDSEHDICSSISFGISEFSSVIAHSDYDCIIVLGDRYELYSICVPAVMHKVPILHIHGGEVTKGAIDNSVRHSITKMASIHFPSTLHHRDTIIQMGENPETIFNVGALGIDNIKSLKLLSRSQFCSVMKISDHCKFNIVTYHPVTLDERSEALSQIKTLLDVLVTLESLSIVTMPNADAFSDTILRTIREYVSRFPEKLIFIESLGQLNYLSAMRHADCMIGNSSSGIIESSSFQLPVVNIGDRQEGRFKPSNVIDCKCVKHEIELAIRKALSSEFKSSIQSLQNPFGSGDTSAKIVNILKQLDLKDKSSLLKKDFFYIGNSYGY